MIQEVPDGWTQVDTEFPAQKQAFMRNRDGLVVSIERGTAHRNEFSAVTLPQNFTEDNQVIDRIHDSDDRAEVEEAAEEFMRENDRQ